MITSESAKCEPSYRPCTTCAGDLYEIEIANKPVLCCENCACVDYNVAGMADSQPQSDKSSRIRRLASLSVAARSLMNGLLLEVDEASEKELTARFEAARAEVFTD